MSEVVIKGRALDLFDPRIQSFSSSVLRTSDLAEVAFGELREYEYKVKRAKRKETSYPFSPEGCEDSLNLEIFKNKWDNLYKAEILALRAADYFDKSLGLMKRHPGLSQIAGGDLDRIIRKMAGFEARDSAADNLRTIESLNARICRIFAPMLSAYVESKSNAANPHSNFEPCPNGLLNAHIRFMIGVDYDKVAAIEALASTFPLRRKDIKRLLKERSLFGMVAERGEEVIGAMIYEQGKGKLHLHHLVVHPSVEGMGVDMQMLVKLMGKQSFTYSTATLEIRDSNLALQKMVRYKGAKAISTLPGFFEVDPNKVGLPPEDLSLTEDAIFARFSHI